MVGFQPQTGPVSVQFMHWNHSEFQFKTKLKGRSPEEKVKGHSGANNKEPQGHNLNNFGRGSFDDVIY